MARCAVLRRWLGGATRACVVARMARRRCIVACARVAVAAALVRRRCVTASGCSACCCSDATALQQRVCHSTQCRGSVDRKQLCDSRTMQRGIDYLQRASHTRTYRWLQARKLDLTQARLIASVRVLSAALTRAEASRTSLRHRPHGTWVRSTTVARPCGHRQEPWWFCSRRRSVDPAARARARERGPRPSIK